MMFNKDLVYLHLPKTGGTSIKSWLKINLAYAPFDMWSLNQYCPRAPDYRSKNSFFAHMTFDYSLNFFNKGSFSFADFKLVFVSIRSPYAMAVSRYFWEKSNGFISQDVNFRDFILRLCADDVLAYSSYYPEKSATFSNFHVFKIDGDISFDAFLAQHGVRLKGTVQPLPKLNSTEHGKVEEYFTPELESLVYSKYSRIIDKHYARLS